MKITTGAPMMERMALMGKILFGRSWLARISAVRVSAAPAKAVVRMLGPCDSVF